MNADAALACLSKAKTSYRTGSGTKHDTIRMVEKSIRLHDTTEAQEFLIFLKASSTTFSAESKNKSNKSKVPAEEETIRPFTPDQVTGIKNILEFKSKGDLYGIFGLEKSCSDSDIKKAYRKYALKFHPDKCGAPRTDDAFKGHAWTVLGDANKRSQYDQYGIDSESANSNNVGQSHHGFSGRPGFSSGFETEISPEDLLRMFMGGGIASGTGGSRRSAPFGFGGSSRFRTHQTQNRQSGPAESRSSILQLLPILFLFLLTAISMFMSEDEPFSFSSTYQYRLEKHTKPHNVKYYVDPQTFQRKYSTSRSKRKLEDQVETEYLHHIRIQCSQERETQAFHIRQASSWFTVDQVKLERAQNMAMPNCQQLNTWYSK